MKDRKGYTDVIDMDNREDDVEFYDDGSSSASIEPLTKFDWRVLVFVALAILITIGALSLALALR